MIADQSLFDLPPVEIRRVLLEEQPYITKEQYYKLFGLETSYDFPSLIVDEQGLFTGGSNDYDKFNKFKVVDKIPVFEEITLRDTEIEEFIFSNKIKQLKIDLLKTSSEIFETHDCYIYPEIMKTSPAVYDTMYLTDYLLKHIFRILMAMIIHGCNEELLKEETYLIGFHDTNGYIKISNIEYEYGFLKIIEYISQFIEDFGLREKQPEIKSQYLEFKESMNATTVLSAAIAYKDIKYKCEENEYQLLPLKVELKMSCREDGVEKEVPQHAKYLIKFFDEYYQDVKRAFPIYNRLENIYRLCAINVMIDDFNHDVDIHETVYVDTYARSISCCGGVLLAPSNFIRIEPKIPAITNKVESICQIKRGLADAPIQIGSIHHAGLLVKTSSNEHHILEWGPSGGTLRKTNPNISNTSNTLSEEGHNWTITSCQSMTKDYEPEGLKKLMDIITFDQPYDLIANNCQDISKKVLNALNLI
jgi:hypothetical protein